MTQVNVFYCPIFLGKIDVKKIKINKKSIKPTWLSQIDSNFYSDDNRIIDKKMGNYLLSTIANYMKNYFEGKEFKITLLNIWVNLYKDRDFQDPHTHAKSDFSFIIYSKVKKSGTVFFNPIKALIDATYDDKKFPGIETIYRPECKQGDLIIFPSFITHMVLPLSKSETIAGNIKIDYVK
jgi:hypothetical protein